MNISRRMVPALVGALFSVSLLVSGLIGTTSADAAGPATVTVRVIGANGQPLLPLTQVTTTTTPVVKDGKPEDSCTGTSAAGALELATKGNWDGEWNSSFGYGVDTIEGVSYPFTQPDYWAFWQDNKSSSTGVCDTEISQGDSLLFFVECYDETAGSCPSSPPNVLAIEAPATAEVGKPTAVTVLSYPNAGGEPVPAMGATVEWSGTTSTPTNAQGQTTLTFSGDGNYTIDAIGAAGESSAIRGEAFVCAHAGNDGTCGTQAAGSPSSATPGSAASSATAYIGPYALVAKAKGLAEGHRYNKRHAPRVLQGTVALHTALRDVKLSLTRRHGRKCSYYDGVTERFRAMKCGASHGVYFSVGSRASFSYLLPAALSPGRYVFDIEATDTAGEQTTLARGTSRIVFYVK